MENLIGDGWGVLLVGAGCLAWSIGGVLMLWVTQLLEKLSVEKARVRTAQPDSIHSLGAWMLSFFARHF